MMINYRNIILSVCLALVFPACKNPGESASKQLYFGIEPYFKKEASKLDKQHIIIRKKVAQNGQQQNRRIRIKDWQKEFELFIQSDINKPAWRGNYTVVNNKNFTIYTAKTPDMKTKKIIIKKNGDKISYIVIANSVKNFLYSSRERLTYYPDSLYRMEKKQQIRLIGQNHYFVEGSIK